MSAPPPPLDRSGCPGTRHGDRTAYKAHGCRCPDASADKARRDKLRAAGVVPSRLIPALGTARRLQALAAIGWPAPRLAAMLEVGPSYLSKAREGANPYVTRGYAARVARLYDRLQGTPGPSRHARTYAGKHGWAPPLAWDDIDDPTERPDLGHGRAGAAQARNERVVALTADGLSIAAIVAQVGCSRRTVQRARGRAS